MAKGNYKDIPMDHAKIADVLAGLNVVNLTETVVREGRHNRYTGSLNSEALWIDVYINKGAKCTLSHRAGDLNAAFTSAADALVAGCRFSEKSRLEERVPDMNAERLSDLLIALQKHGATIEEDSQTKIYRLVRLCGPLKDKLTLKLYGNGTLQLQGVHGQVAGWTLAALGEMLPIDTILDHQKRIYKVDISVEQVNDDLACRIPYAHTVLHPSVRVQLASSLVLTKTGLNLEDHAVLAFPALKALEGFAFQLINDKFTPAPAQMQKFGDYVQLVNGRAEIISAYQAAATPAVARALERCYRLWYDNRHSLFHMDQVLDATRFIDQREDAVEIVNMVLDLIESCCHEVY